MVYFLTFQLNSKLFLKVISEAGVALSVIDCLPSKHKALSSNPSTAKNKKENHFCSFPLAKYLLNAPPIGGGVAFLFYFYP
jgi:hypothetical protein